MNRLRQLISIRNLTVKRSAGGQIAIFLLLAVGVVLVFALATANLGAVSTTAIRMDNAADAAALDLSSELATRSNMLYDALGGTEGKCQRTGILPVFLAVVFAAIITIATGGAGGPLGAMMIAAAAGAVGGAIGGAILHGNLKGALQGAIQGAAIGAAIGGAYAGVGAAFGTPVSWAAPSGAVISTTILSTTAAAAGAAFSGASSIYAAAVKEQVNAKSFAMLAKALNGLPDEVRLRESAIFQAMSQVVDDPNRVPDRLDSDEDGDVQALVPAFQHFWTEHLQTVRAGVTPPPSQPTLGELIEDFVTGDGVAGRQGLSEFAQEARKFLRWFEREEIECGPPGRGVEGAAVSLWRVLKPYLPGDITFWTPGPDRDKLLRWYDAECRLTDCATGCRVVGCPAPPLGYDEVDGVSTELKSLIEAASGVMQPQDPGLTPEELQNLARASQLWLNIFADDDPDSNGDFLDTLPGVEQAIRRWITKTEEVRGRLPGCQLAYGPTVDSNLVGPGDIDPGFDERNPFYPCVWERRTSNPRTGTFLHTAPNTPPFCKIDAGREKEDLTNQIARVEQAVRNGRASIDSLASCGVDCISSVPSTTLQVGLSNSQLQYTYRVDWTCTCTTSGCKPNPCPPPRKNCGCTSWSRTDTTSQSRVGEGSQFVDARDLSFPIRPDGEVLGTILPNFQATIDDVTARSGGTFATLDQDPEDEFYPVLEQLRGARDGLTAFLAALRQFSDGMQPSQQTELRKAANPEANDVTYTWTDSRGEHSVRVRVGPFRFAKIGTEESGNIFWGKKCLVLKNYWDDHTAWVEITRKDPTPALGFWNWGGFHGGRITRCASGNYAYDHVTLWDKCPGNR